MSNWYDSYTLRALAASLLIDVGAALSFAAGGGEVNWIIILYSLGNKVAIGAARLLLGQPPDETHPPAPVA